jgi:hypothetical protein
MDSIPLFTSLNRHIFEILDLKRIVFNHFPFLNSHSGFPHPSQNELSSHKLICWFQGSFLLLLQRFVLPIPLGFDSFLYFGVELYLHLLLFKNVLDYLLANIFEMNLNCN